MIIKVKPHKLELIKDQPVNEKEIDISRCYFEFDEEITDDYVKEAYFTLNNNTYKVILLNDECSIPYEVLETKGMIEIGVVAYKIEDEVEIKRYNPSPVYFNSIDGSLKEATNAEPITPTDKEQIEQMLDNINITAEKVEDTTTITITNKDGSQQVTYILDGEQGPKGEPGAIKFEIVAELPTEEIKEDTIYLVPIEPDTQGNNYAEYIYVNGEWELLGKIGVQVDLSNYVTFNDYALWNKGGVVKTGNGFDLSTNGIAQCGAVSYSNYQLQGNTYFISKGTLENVITGKDLTTKTYVDGLVGDIETILTTLDIGGGV